MPSNIKNNHTRNIRCNLLFDEYYDFMLYKGETYKPSRDLSSLCIADFSDWQMENGKLYSSIIWGGAKNGGVYMEDIGLTGTDNGLIKFDKSWLSTDKVLEVLTGSTYEIEEDDNRFFLSPITGNTQKYIYPLFYTEDEESGEKYMSFKGGFFQGFYKLFGFDYQTLPTQINNEWNLNFTLRPRSDYNVEEDTINQRHIENKGIFFFMGTRAENKFWYFYNYDSGMMETLKEVSDEDNFFIPCEGESGETYDPNRIEILTTDYAQDEEMPNPEEENIDEESYFADEDYKTTDTSLLANVSYNVSLSDYFTEDNYFDWYGNTDDKEYKQTTIINALKPEYKQDGVTDDYYYTSNASYFTDVYFEEGGAICSGFSKSVETEYLLNDREIDRDEYITSLGHLPNKKGYYEIVTDNKFLIFDRTENGMTTKNWIEGTKVTLYGRKDWNVNLFPLMNRTKTGWTVDTIQEYYEKNTKKYNIYNDLKNNAFALRITDNGAIGYKYAIFDCDTEQTHYKLHEEYSKDNIVKFDEWNNIVVKIKNLTPQNESCAKNKQESTIKLYIYVNGYLKFISKDLPNFNFRELNEEYQKQEAVPYNMSIGGGTQGLMEAIYPDFYNTPAYILPIERDFGGSFMGDIKNFTIYDGAVDYFAIRNYL